VLHPASGGGSDPILRSGLSVAASENLGAATIVGFEFSSQRRVDPADGAHESRVGAWAARRTPVRSWPRGSTRRTINPSAVGYGTQVVKSAVVHLAAPQWTNYEFSYLRPSVLRPLTRGCLKGNGVKVFVQWGTSHLTSVMDGKGKPVISWLRPAQCGAVSVGIELDLPLPTSTEALANY
jgi:hypothetical protein